MAEGASNEQEERRELDRQKKGKNRQKKREETYCGINSDEELGPVGAWTRVGHGDRVRAIVPQVSVKLINEVVAPNGLAAGAVTLWIARLNHEALNNTVKEVPVVILVFNVGGEVLHCKRGKLWEQLHSDISVFLKKEEEDVEGSARQLRREPKGHDKDQGGEWERKWLALRWCE